MIGAIFLQIILIFLNAVFASAEIAVISMKETKLKQLDQQGNLSAKRLRELIQEPARFLATIQVAITLAGLLGSAFAAENFAAPISQKLIEAGVQIPEKALRTVMLFIITVVLAYFNLVFGELVPKRLAMKKAESMALGMSGMLYGVSKVFAPLVFILTISTNSILRLLHIDPQEEDSAVTEEEILLLLAEGSQQGTIPVQEQELIQNVFAFDDLSAEQLCTHRRDLISLRAEDTMEQWRTIILEKQHTFYPIYQENTENIVGVLNTKKYFRLINPTKEQVLSKAVEEPFYIPENMKANLLFEKMKQKRNYFAILLDEYGGLSGVITMQDLLEELVGILYEPDAPLEPEEIQQMEHAQWCILGSANLSSVERELQVSLPVDIYDTFHGFVCGLLDRIPDDGETIECEGYGLHILSDSIENHLIKKAYVKKIR